MNKLNKFLMMVPEKLCSIIWRLQAVLWILLAGSYVVLQKELFKIEKKEYLAKYFWVFIGITAVIILAGHIKKLAYSRIPLLGYLCSAVIAMYGGFRYISYVGLQAFDKSIFLFLALAAAIYIIFLAVNTLLGLGFRSLLGTVFEGKQFGYTLLLLAVINFIRFYFLPASMFFSNYSEFGFPYQLLAKAFISNYLMWTIVPAVFFGMMRKKVFNICYSVAFALLLGIYVQYMGFNTSLVTINGQKYHWTAHPLLTVLNLLVWIALLAGMLIFLKKKTELAKKFAYYGTIFLGLIHVVSYVALFVGADSAYFKYVDTYFDYNDQFKVGTDNNIIVFVIDAADNKFMQELCEQDAKVLEQFHDFDIYTNTCSVYDYTSMSLLQMTTNVPFNNEVNDMERREIAWNTEWADEFYDRLHGAGYKVEFFNFDHENSNYVLGRMDNAHSGAEENYSMYSYISYKTLRADVGKIINYQIFPMMLKGLTGIENVDLCDIIVLSNITQAYANEEFEEKINLSLAEGENYVLYEHIQGCHEPVNTAETLDFCLGAVGKYMQQMKELGVYDNATIIVTADHGCHDPSDNTGTGMFASTPILMVKQPNETKASYDLNSAPVYSTDLMPTILYSAGLYDPDSAEDVDLFGPTIYDFKEGELRTRTWYDRVNDPNYPDVGTYTTYYGYTYTGDTKELERVVENGENLVIYPVPIQNDGM